jgi:hypothetical protein
MPDDTVTSAATPAEGTAQASGTSAMVPDTSVRPDRPFGWGADLPLENRPAVPMERMPARLEGVHWQQPEQQRQHVKVLHSIERPGITPIFGSTVPLSGLSGMLRGVAFRYSESDLRHWLLLLAADRLNIGEGLVDDLLSGRVPNVPAEMGLRAEWEHNPRGAVAKVGVVVGAVALVVFALSRRRRR